MTISLYGAWALYLLYRHWKWTEEYHYFSKFSLECMPPYPHSSNRAAIWSLFLYEVWRRSFFYTNFYQNLSLILTYFQNFLVKLINTSQQACSLHFFLLKWPNCFIFLIFLMGACPLPTYPHGKRVAIISNIK